MKDSDNTIIAVAAGLLGGFTFVAFWRFFMPGDQLCRDGACLLAGITAAGPTVVAAITAVIILHQARLLRVQNEIAVAQAKEEKIRAQQQIALQTLPTVQKLVQVARIIYAPLTTAAREMGKLPPSNMPKGFVPPPPIRVLAGDLRENIPALLSLLDSEELAYLKSIDIDQLERAVQHLESQLAIFEQMFIVKPDDFADRDARNWAYGYFVEPRMAQEYLQYRRFIGSAALEMVEAINRLYVRYGIDPGRHQSFGLSRRPQFPPKVERPTGRPQTGG